MKHKQKVDVYWMEDFGPVVRAEDYQAVCDEAETLVRERDELKKQNKLYAGMLVYGSEVVFPRGDETTEEEAIAAIDAKSAELNNVAMQENQS